MEGSVFLEGESWIEIVRRKSVLPEIYLAVDDDQEEKRENAVYDQVGVSQVNLIIYKL